MKKEKPVVQLSGVDGNAYSIMNKVAKGLKDNGYTVEEINEYLEESKSGDYDNLLQVAMRWAIVK